jgi:hypothetical protein
VADAFLSRQGQIAGTGDPTALFLKLGFNEVIAAFERDCIFKNWVRTRNITKGKSAAFPVTGRRTARYHVPGTPILGETNAPSANNEEVVNLDALIIADEVVYDLDEAMSYYEVRQDITRELGSALARDWDARAARVIHACAKRVTPQLAKAINADRIGQTQVLTAGYAAANKQAKGDELVSAIGNLKVAMKKKDVPTDNLVLVVPPDEYDFLNESSKATNRDFTSGNNGGLDDGRVLRVKGIPVYESNHVTQPAYTNVANSDRNIDYQQNLTRCRGLLFHRDAIGVLTLKAPQMEMTAPNGDFFKMYQATLMLAKMAIGMKSLRPECAAVIEVP